MKSPYYRIISRLIIIGFIFYWILSIAMSVSITTKENRLANIFPTFNFYFGHTWGLFFQGFDFDDRLYVVVRDKQTKQATDTVELLQEIYHNKSSKAPFNQAYYIEDRLVSHYVTLIKHKQVEYMETIKKEFPGATDSLLNAHLQASEYLDPLFLESIHSLDKYCEKKLLEKHVDTTGKEFKIVIKEKMVKPYEERANKDYSSEEVLYFESLFNSFKR